MAKNKTTFLILASLSFILGCSSEPKAVNSTTKYPVIIPSDSSRSLQVTEEVLLRPPNQALGGKVLLEGNFPSSLAHVPLALFKKEGDSWKLITELSSGSDGGFHITRSILPGDYELRITSGKFSGTAQLHVDRPLDNIILMAKEKK